jgi:hypothetical protein
MGSAINVNDDELASLLNSLEDRLGPVGLSSLVNQERILASEGIIEEVTHAEAAELRLNWSRSRTGRAPSVNAGDVRIRPLGVRERLAELLDLLEIAIGGSYAIEVHLRDDLKASSDEDLLPWNGQVVFANPPESALVTTEGHEWTLPDQSTLQQREAAVRQVVSLINQIREVAELPRSETLHTVTASNDDDSSTDLSIPGGWS